MEHWIAVRFEYEWHDAMGQWYRAYGNENWEFAENGLMMRRFASITMSQLQNLTASFTGNAANCWGAIAKNKNAG